MVRVGVTVLAFAAFSCGFQRGSFSIDDAAPGTAEDMMTVGGDVVDPDAPTVTPRKCTLLLGSDHSCALRASDKSLWCVGDNSLGQLGRGGALGGSSTAVTQVNIGAVTTASGRSFHVCAGLENGAAMCWGQNDRAQLGDGTTTSRATPAAVMNLSGVVEIGAARSFNCARRSNNTVTCWGDNDAGQLGDTTTTDHATPTTSVAALPKTPIELLPGSGHACVRYADGTGSCWGSNAYGQLGDGTQTDRSTAIALPSNVTPVRAIATGGYSTNEGAGGQTCVVHSGGGVSCWGSNQFGQLGNAQTGGLSTAPVAVTGISDAVDIVMGRYHVCVRRGTAGGNVSCWGHNNGGQLGDNSYTDRSAPVSVTLPRPAVHIAAGGYHTCALLDDDSVRCWGYNSTGQLADTSTTTRLTPVASSLCP